MSKKQKKQKKQDKLSKRIRNFTFKIDIDYWLRGLCQQQNITDPVLIQQYLDANREQYHQFLLNNFKKFCADNKFNVEKATCILHDKDTHIDKKLKKRVPDDWHMHFLCVTNNTASIRAWRKRLRDYGLVLSDEGARAGESRDFDEMKKTNFANSFAYHIHRTLQAIHDGKYAYDQDDPWRVWSMGIDADEKRKLYAQAVAPKQLKNVVDTDDPVNKKINGFIIGEQEHDNIESWFEPAENAYTEQIRHGMTVAEIKIKAEKMFGGLSGTFWRKYHKGFENEQDEYNRKLMQQLPYRDRNFSLFLFSGKGGTGKTVIADQLAYWFSDTQSHAIHSVATAGKRKTFDLAGNYNNELVSVSHEITPTSLGVDEFENIAEPHRFPSINSRNKDRAYFAQALILTQPDSAYDFAYRMIYSDYLKYGRRTDVYGYHVEIEKDDNFTEKMYFPNSYDSFVDAFENDNSQYWDHWTLKDTNQFFTDIWQILRRIRFTINVERLSNETNEVYLTVKHVKENEQMKTVENWADFITNMWFDNYYEVVGKYYIDDFLNTSHVQVVLKQILKDLKEKCNLKINSSLPKLLTNEQLHKLMCDDDSNSLYDDIEKKNDEETTKKDDTISSENEQKE